MLHILARHRFVNKYKGLMDTDQSNFDEDVDMDAGDGEKR